MEQEQTLTHADHMAQSFKAKEKKHSLRVIEKGFIKHHIDMYKADGTNLVFVYVPSVHDQSRIECTLCFALPNKKHYPDGRLARANILEVSAAWTHPKERQPSRHAGRFEALREYIACHRMKVRVPVSGLYSNQLQSIFSLMQQPEMLLDTEDYTE